MLDLIKYFESVLSYNTLAQELHMFLILILKTYVTQP